MYAASGTSNDCAHVEDGYYSLELTTTDTSTPGYLRISLQITGALIFHEDFNILPANIYDSRYSTDKLEVDVTQWKGTTAATVDGAGTVRVTLEAGAWEGPDESASRFMSPRWVKSHGMRSYGKASICARSGRLEPSERGRD